MKKNIKLTVEDVKAFERLKQQLIQLNSDINILSKKSPDAPINKLKLIKGCAQFMKTPIFSLFGPKMNSSTVDLSVMMV